MLEYRRGRAMWTGVSSLLIGWAAILSVTAEATGQSAGGLELDNLNIRLQTEHYLLAGTVSQSRLTEYGKYLEFAHAEYSRGFRSLLQTDSREKAAKDRRGAKEPAPKGDQKRQPADSRQGKGGKAKGRSAESDAEDEQAPPKKAIAKKKTKRNALPASDAEGRSITKEDEQGRLRVIIFASDRDYQAFGKEFLGGWTEHTNGMYICEAKLLLIEDHARTELPYDVLFHEAFHQFLGGYLKDPPTWLNEGLATYYGSARPTQRGLAFTNPPRWMWEFSRELVDHDKAVPLAEIIFADAQTFYDTTPVNIGGYKNVVRRNAFYAQSYTLMHMLLEDPQGRARVQNLIRDLAKDDGTHTNEIQARYFDDKTCGRLSAAWLRYIKVRREFSAK